MGLFTSNITARSRNWHSRDKVWVPWHCRNFEKFSGIEASYTTFCGTEGIGSMVNLCIVSVGPCMHSWTVLHACHAMMCGSSIIYCISSIVSTWWHSRFLHVRHTGKEQLENDSSLSTRLRLTTNRTGAICCLYAEAFDRESPSIFQKRKFWITRSHGLKF